MDFGIARASEPTPDHSTGLVIGTPAYMSPEQAQGKSVDPRSDIYSLGLVLYELFTGQQAMQAETPAALAMKQIRETPRPPQETDRFLPIFLSRAIEKCLHKDPSKRFQSVAELARALAGEEKAHSKEIELPKAYCTWQLSDYLLALAATVGCMTYFLVQEHAFPARDLSLQVDRNVAAKLAQDFAKQMGVGEQPVSEVQLRFHTSTESVDSESIDWGELRFLKGKDAALARLSEISPFRWLVFLGNHEKPIALVTLNSTNGSVIRFSRLLPRDGKATTPTPTSIDLVREEAKKQLEKLFSINWTETKLDVEQLGALAQYWTYGAAFTTNEANGPRTRYYVGLTDGRTTSLARSLVKWEGMPELAWYQKTPEWWGAASRVSMGMLIVGLFAFLAKRALAHWRIALGGAIIVAVASAYNGVSGWWISGSLAVDEFLKSFALSGINAFLGIALAAHLGFRAFPEKFLAFKVTHSPNHKAVALSILRGSFLGFCVLGFQNLLLELGYRTNSFWIDPEVLAAPAEAGNPGIHFLSNTVLYSVLVTVVGILLPLSFMAVRFPRAKGMWMLATGLWLTLLSGEFNWLEPWLANVGMLFIAGFILGAILIKWDALTLLACLFTFEAFLVGYPSLVLHSSVRAYSLYATFGLLVFALSFSFWVLTRPLLSRKLEDFFSAYR